MTKKIKVVLDTSALIQCQLEIEKMINDDCYELFISSIVASELDNMKESDGSRRSFNGRSALRFIKKNEDVFTYIEAKEFSLNDDAIIQTAIDNKASIMTKDMGMWIKCKAKKITIVEIKSEEEVNYNGYRIFEWDCMDDAIAEKLNLLAEDSTNNIFNLEMNEFAILKDTSRPIFNEDGISDDFEVQAIMQWDGSNIINMKYKNINNSFVGKVYPRNIQQKMLFSLMQNDKIKIILASGAYGSGKDYVQLSNALELVQKNKYDKIVWFRNNVNVKGIKEMGYLPGSFEEKSKPFSAILDDILGEQFGTEMFIASGKLEIGNLGAVRGRTFKNSIIFLTEMQNCSIEVIQLLVSRLGENSILVMNGDFRQIDDVKHGESSVRETINVLAGQEEFGWINLEKVERSKTANLARLFDEI